MSRAFAHGISKRAALWIGSSVAALALIAAVTPAVFAATETPGFCTSCHEMRPFHAAWAQGAHKDISCVSCHVEPGTVNRVTHKLTALKEVWIHTTGDPRFPVAAGSADVPNDRCLMCHADIRTKNPSSGFSHVKHAQSEKRCITCHSDAGHKVTTAALAAEGVLATSTATKTPTWNGVAAAQAAALDSTSSAPVHVAVSCTSCHDLAVTPCATCHSPKHAQRKGDCTTCHSVGPKWAFSHPVRTDCTTCHTAPKPHFPGACTTCHVAGTDFKQGSFTHIASSKTGCTSCHARPAKHRPGTCTSCHAAGSAWTFKHPSAGARCSSCHTAPAKHYGTTCSTCHKPGVPFRNATFKHPSAGARCLSCHKTPAGHRKSSCTSCHTRVGVSWAFRHPSSKACASCHRPPSRHYGSTCSSCHSPRVPFRNAHFNHPRVPGGEHTNRSFACVKCHPSGPPKTDCVTCHRQNGGD